MSEFRSVSFAVCVALIMIVGCVSDITNDSEVYVAGAMKNVMWKGELDAIIMLDTISNKEGLYGIGPLAGLRGELMIWDGVSYVSKVENANSIVVEQTDKVGAPFFVYGHQTDWKQLNIPESVTDIKQLEQFIDAQTTELKRPFIFKLTGKVGNASIHVQDLSPGTIVRAPQEAHQGQFDKQLNSVEADMVGFFSKEHQGIFTHHDAIAHIHFISKDRKVMGHLDALDIEASELSLFVPIE